MTLALYGRLIMLAGRDQPANAAFIPNRLVVLYSTLTIKPRTYSRECYE